MLIKLFLLAAAAQEALSCAQHENHQRHPHLGKRQIVTTNPGRPLPTGDMKHPSIGA
jgi:hypothetical protein